MQTMRLSRPRLDGLPDLLPHLRMGGSTRIMGTNYYIEAACPNPCEHCNPPRLHVGKSSAGWRFLANADDMGTRSWLELVDRIALSVVTNEYGEFVDDLVGRIEAKAELRSHIDDAEYPSWMTPRNDTEDGPVDFTEGEFS